jgi:hypothetical protein
MCLAVLGISFPGSLLEAFAAMVNQGIIPVTCAAESGNRLA